MNFQWWKQDRQTDRKIDTTARDKYSKEESARCNGDT